MGFKRYYSFENNFVITRATGSIADEDLFEQVANLKSETKNMSYFRELADLTNIKDLKKLSVSAASSAGASEPHRPGCKFAIYLKKTPLMFGMVRAYQTFSEEKREEVRKRKEKR